MPIVYTGGTGERKVIEMVIFEQVMLWLALFLIGGSAIMFGIAFLIAWHYGLRFRCGKDRRVKEEMLMAERMRAKKEAEQAATQRAGGLSGASDLHDRAAGDIHLDRDDGRQTQHQRQPVSR
jgi:hypothetical protein